MAKHIREKQNPSSRYSRIEDPWLDDEDRKGPEEIPGDVMADGYGVRDSYSRQASYGRGEGYYPEDSPGRTDAYYGQDPYDDSGTGYGQDPYEGSGREYGQGGYEGSGTGYGQDPYDSPQSHYGPGPRSGASGNYGRDPYDQEEWNPDPDGYAYGQRSGHNHGPAGSSRGPGAGAAAPRRSKRGFIVKLILLLIAAAVLAFVWRFSRMKHVSLTDILTNSGVSSPSGYKEFVIYGVDSREGNLTKDAHSDTIILCSMNKSTKEIRMVSVYRDTYLDNTNGEYHKATECYYYGGPSRSVNMLNKNLDLDLHDYITVDFNAVVKAVDLIGGVDVEVTEEELPYINGYQTENAQVTGAMITPVESAGYQHLNGIQALAYCRIRYTEGWDFRRTERQRTVLSQIFSQAKSQGPVRMAQIVDAMLPYIATSFSSADLLSLASSVSDCTLLDSVGFPFDQVAANVDAGDCVVPVNLASNVSQLHTYLYQQAGYTPTQTVQDISADIANRTGIY